MCTEALRSKWNGCQVIGLRNDIKGRKGIVYLFNKNFEIKINIYRGIEKSTLFYPQTPPQDNN